MIKEFTREPDPLLRTKSVPVAFPLDDVAKEVIRDLFDTSRDCKALGLAANQIGSNLAIFVVTIEGFQRCCINPEIIATTGPMQSVVEGCFSFDGEHRVERPFSVTMRYCNEEGEEKIAARTGLKARCLLHELDHLNGVSITDKKNAGSNKHRKHDVAS